MNTKVLSIKRLLIYCAIQIVILIFLLSPFAFVNISLVGDRSIILDYSEKYSEPGFKASLFDKEITSDVSINGNVENEIGTYLISYNYKFLIYNIERTRKVEVMDLTGPEITLNGEEEMNITINTSYEEPGFTAIDKLDGDVTDKVIVTNNININELGDYEVLYEVTDNAGNVSKKTRKVKVQRPNPTQMSLKDYTLDGWYDEAKLKPTANAGDAYFDRITVIGDSNIMDMYLFGVSSGMNTWAIPCLHAGTMHTTEVNLYGLGIKMKLIDAIEKYKPEIILLNFGVFSSAWVTEDVFIEKANAMINQIKEKSPNTKIILSSVYPVRPGESLNHFKQEAINKINFLILEMAYKHNVKYLDIQEVLKGSDGYARYDYYMSDKYHVNYSGQLAIKEYIKTHALGGV